MAEARFSRVANADPATSEEVAGIRRALHALLSIATDDALVSRFRPPGADEGLGRPFKDVLKLFDRSLAERDAAALVRDPVGEAVRSAIAVLGERLDEIGGLGLMTGVLDDVAEMDPPNEGRRIGIMDHRWSGIGSWRA